MKRILALLLTLSLALSLAACGGTPATDVPNATSAPTTAPSEGPKVVSNVNDFLAAIAPDTEILLAEGDYLLSSALDYGSSQNPYYTWEGQGLGEYTLVIQNVSNLTIRGGGQGKTSILSEHAFSNVMDLSGCKNVTLEGLSMGHTQRTEHCEGYVLGLRSCESTTLNDLDLYGCGSVGLYSYDSKDITLQDCNIHDCSNSAMALYDTTGLTARSSIFRSMGGELPASFLVTASHSGDITVSDCVFSDNYVGRLIDVADSLSPVSFQNNQITGNRVSGCMLSLVGENLILDGNVFEDNQFRNWYGDSSAHAVDLEGNELTFEEESAPAAESGTPGTAVPVSTGEQKQVHVSTADEFLAALDSDTCIILDTELLDLATATEYPEAEKSTRDAIYPNNIQEGYTNHYYWENNYDGPSLVISDLHNLTIMAEGTDRKAHTISATPRYAYVLTFENCSAITISGFTAGHTKEPGLCVGGVVAFRNCENTLVDNCGLFGCGTVGVYGESSRNMQVVGSEIYECSIYGIQLRDCDTVAISGTLIRDIGDEYFPEGPFYSFSGSANVTLDGQSLDGNYEGR